MVSVYLQFGDAARLAEFIVYSFLKSAEHACSNAKSYFIFETLCIVKNILKMRKNPNKTPKEPTKKVESDNESVPETTVPDLLELPESVAGDSTDRSRPVFENKSSDVRERAGFKLLGWDCVQKKKSFEEGRKEKVEEFKRKNGRPLTRVAPQQSSPKKQNGPRKWGTRSMPPPNFNTQNSTSVTVESRSRSPVKKLQPKKPEKPVERRSSTPAKPAAVTNDMVKKNTKRVEETLQHRWLRLGGPRTKPEYTRSYTQSKEDPALRNERLTNRKSVGIKIQTRLDHGILDAEISTGDYLREEFKAHQEVPKLKAELASKKIEFKFLSGCMNELKGKLVEGEVEKVKKDLILKKTIGDKEKSEKKREKLKKRKNELKKIMADLAVITENDRRAAALRNRNLERENRALRTKISLMSLDHQDMKPVTEYDTDNLLSADEEGMADEDCCDEKDGALSDTDSDCSEGSESWDLYLERDSE